MLSTPSLEIFDFIIIIIIILYCTHRDVKHRVVKHIFNAEKKKGISLFIHTTLGQREALRRVINVNDGINKVVFNINSHCFSSYQIITFILGNIPKIMNAHILDCCRVKTKTEQVYCGIY